MPEVIKPPAGICNALHLSLMEIRMLRQNDAELAKLLLPFEQAYLLQFSNLSDVNKEVLEAKRP